MGEGHGGVGGAGRGEQIQGEFYERGEIFPVNFFRRAAVNENGLDLWEFFQKAGDVVYLGALNGAVAGAGALAGFKHVPKRNAVFFKQRDFLRVGKRRRHMKKRHHDFPEMIARKSVILAPGQSHRPGHRPEDQNAGAFVDGGWKAVENGFGFGFHKINGSWQLAPAFIKFCGKLGLAAETYINKKALH